MESLKLLKKSKIKQLNFFTLLLFSIMNVIICIVYKKNVFIYALPFFIFLFIYVFIHSYKIDTCIFIAASAFSILFGEWGELQGAIFLYISYHFHGNLYLFIISFICTIITIMIKIIFNSSFITNAFIYIIGFIYIFILCYILFFPKKLYNIVIDEDKINLKIIDFLIQGNRIKEISNKVYLSENAITKRIEKMRVKYNCRNNEQLVYNFTEKGYIRHN